MKTKVEQNKLTIEMEMEEFDNDLLLYLTSYSISKKSKARQKDIDSLAQDIKTKWWNENKRKFIHEDYS